MQPIIEKTNPSHIQVNIHSDKECNMMIKGLKQSTKRSAEDAIMIKNIEKAYNDLKKENITINSDSAYNFQIIHEVLKNADSKLLIEDFNLLIHLINKSLEKLGKLEIHENQLSQNKYVEKNVNICNDAKVYDEKYNQYIKLQFDNEPTHELHIKDIKIKDLNIFQASLILNKIFLNIESQKITGLKCLKACEISNLKSSILNIKAKICIIQIYELIQKHKLIKQKVNLHLTLQNLNIKDIDKLYYTKGASDIILSLLAGIYAFAGISTFSYILYNVILLSITAASI